MPSINWSALWKILVVGSVCGAGLPAPFAVGLRALARSRAGAMAPAPPRPDRVHPGHPGNPVGLAIAVVCFAVVLVAVGWGIDLIVSSR